MPSDFNGDGRDDIVWRNGNGAFSTWLADSDGGFTVNDSNAMRFVGTQWNVAGTGDFNGDGRDDVLWLNDSTGMISNWLGTPEGGFLINDSAALISLPQLGWFVHGVGDFNSDGRDDILINNDAGLFTIWTASQSGGFQPSNVNYNVTQGQYIFTDSVADFDGFGADVLWYDPASGNVGYYWNWGGELISIDLVTPSAGGGWQIAGTGDFDGDGFDDILWRHPNGALSNWLSDGNGNFIVNDANAMALVPVDWQVIGIGDFNGDGRDDILWRNVANGTLTDWLATPTGGFVVNDAAAATPVSLDWYVAPGSSGAGLWDY